MEANGRLDFLMSNRCHGVNEHKGKRSTTKEWMVVWETCMGATKSHHITGNPQTMKTHALMLSIYYYPFLGHRMQIHSKLQLSNIFYKCLNKKKSTTYFQSHHHSHIPIYHIISFFFFNNITLYIYLLHSRNLTYFK